MNRCSSSLVLLILSTTVLVSGIFTSNVPTAAVLAYSTILKQDTKQNANCDTAGANSPVSDSCNQQSTNNVNNGVPRTTGTSGSHPTTGILRVTCGSEIRELACPAPIKLTGNNPQPSSILCLICIIDVTLGSGPFTVTAENTLGVTTSFSDDCRQTAHGSQEATGTIAAGQFLTCNINAG